MHGLQVLWTKTITPVYGNELDLNKGRFEHFLHERQEYVVKVRLCEKKNYMSNEEFAHLFDERLEWVADRAVEPWSFHLHPHSVHHDMDIEFSFAQPRLAVIFKLVWG